MKGSFDTIAGYAVKWSVMAVIFAAPFSKSIGEIGIVIAIAVWAVAKMMKRDFTFRNTMLAVPLLVMVITILPSFFNTPSAALSIKALFSKVLKYVFFYFAIVGSMDSRSKLKDIFWIAVLSIIVVLFDAAGQYMWRVDALHSYPAFQSRPAYDFQGFFRGFPTACFPFPNDFASWILLVIFPVSCAVLFDLRASRMRYLAAVLSVALFYMLFLTKTRAAWLGFGISMLYLAVAKQKAWIVILLAIALAVPFVFNMDIATHLSSFSSVTDRIGMWRVGWKIFSDHPVIGNGLNTFFNRFKECRTDESRGLRGSYAHNCYLQMAGDVGVVGLAGFLFFIGAYFVSVVRNMQCVTDPLLKSVLLGISVGVFAFLVHAFFDTNLYSLNLVTLFWCAIGVSMAIIKVSKKEAA